MLNNFFVCGNSEKPQSVFPLRFYSSEFDLNRACYMSLAAWIMAIIITKISDYFFYLLRFCSKYLAFTLFALLREDRPPDGFFFFFPFYPVVSVSCYLSLVSIEPAWNDQCPYSIASSAVTLSVYRHWSLDNNYPTSFVCNDRITLARFCRFSADVLALVRLYD